MFQSRIIASTLVALVSVPGFLVGQRLQQGDLHAAMWLTPCLAVVVFIASALMRQSDAP